LQNDDVAEFNDLPLESYWWLFGQLMDTVKGDAIAARPGDYVQRNPIVRAQCDQLEQAFAAEVPEIWRGYVAAGDPRMLDRFTERCVERVVRTPQGMLNEWNAEPKEVSA
jgi:hypothetical protein